MGTLKLSKLDLETVRVDGNLKETIPKAMK